MADRVAIQRRLERSTTDEEVEALVERYAGETGLLFTVDTLEFRAKGGRIGRARALAGQLLNVKPVLTITDGEVVPLTRVRGWGNAMAEFEKRFTEATDDSAGLHVGIAHAQAPDRHARLKKAFRDIYVNELRRSGSTLDEAMLDKLLATDIELNAQGAGVWLDRQSRKA